MSVEDLEQMLFSKALASQITVPDAKLFAIKLGIAKATNMNIEYMILIINSLGSAKILVDSSVYSRQTYSLAVCFVLRSFYSCGLNYRIKF